MEAPDPRRDGRDDLDGAGAGADHADGLAFEGVGVVPAGGVERLAGEGGEAGDLRVGRPAEPAGGRDDGPGDHGVALAGLDGPEPRALVERGPRGGCAEADVGADAVLVRAALEVGEDLAPLRELAGPAGVLLERERVEVRLDVAGGTRIAVVTPGATQALGLLQHGEVVDARLLEADGHAEAAEAGADDDDVRVAHGALAFLSRETGAGQVLRGEAVDVLVLGVEAGAEVLAEPLARRPRGGATRARGDAPDRGGGARQVEIPSPGRGASGWPRPRSPPGRPSPWPDRRRAGRSSGAPPGARRRPRRGARSPRTRARAGAPAWWGAPRRGSGGGARARRGWRCSARRPRWWRGESARGARRSMTP